jgi:scytalone dehydratase
MNYRKVDGVWKFAGLTPNIRWYEYDYDKMFGPPPAKEGETNGH